ncbi:hypothetical protein COU60_05485 [Candidatus Pacearchaeota archaeon CG10_big_fil_rev_8_21_14_0_10_34_76]|nr:MAG: hypothetical protein COU60_05485 [Candidatus Pacearchaeota archaeon CG10_big_fil_rev_8_21_14_0_10_34_76]
MFEGIVTLIAFLLILEGAFITFNPRWIQKITRKLLKNKTTLRTLGVIELIIGLGLFLVILSA